MKEVLFYLAWFSLLGLFAAVVYVSDPKRNENDEEKAE
jgi:hypothetical protein